jgi:hypothetical protein
MHECPHCHRRGISSFDAVGNPFAHGRVSCRYCRNTSRRRFHVAARFVPAVAVLALFGIVKTVHEPAFRAFWMVFALLAMYTALDDLTTFEKVETS